MGVRDPPLNDQFAIIAPRFSGFTSAVASACIIYLIARSNVKLSSIYHRIMFGMSIADIIGSVAMGLTFLPMPKNLEEYWVKLNEIEDYSEANYGNKQSYGNKQTCQAQGFCILGGGIIMYLYNCSLCIYYACAIALRLNDIFIAKYLEPFYHLIPLALGLTIAIIPLVADLYHPTFGWDAWCYVNVDLSDKPGIRGAIVSVILFLLSMVILSFIMITWRVMKTESILKSQFQKMARRGRLNFNTVQRSHENTKVILFQAFFYISALIITIAPQAIRGFAAVENIWLARVALVLTPLQGFFNLLIFISHKIYNYRRLHQDVSRCEVLRLLFRGSLREPVILSRISIVECYQRGKKEFVNIEVEDEEHNVEQLSFALNGNDNDNDEGIEIFSEDPGAERTADRSNQKLEDLCTSSFLDQVESADGARLNISNDSDIISISDSRAGLSGFSSKLSSLISDGDDTNHDGKKGTKKEVTSHDHDSSLLSYQSTGRFNVSIDGASGVSFSSSSAGRGG